MIDNKRCVSRREFLKIAGIAGATVGVGAGLGGLVSSCGSTTTTTSGGPSTESTTATTGGTTTVSTGPEAGREIKIGYVVPITGSLSAFAVPTDYQVERVNEALGDGLVCGDGLKHKITWIVRDSQSDSNRAAQVAGDLINNDKVDIIMAAASADTVNPVADQAEANGVPCLSTSDPWQNYVFGRGGTATTVWKWTYNIFFGVEDLIAIFLSMWAQVPTNKKVSVMLGNDAIGNAWVQPWKGALPKAGLTGDFASQFQPGTEDFSAPISQFKKNGDEIALGLFSPPDFSNYWKQCLQQGYHPKTVAIAIALQFPQAAAALGDSVINLGCPGAWNAGFPVRSSLLNETARQFADDYEKRTNSQWTQPLGFQFVLFEWAVDVLKRAKSVDDKEALLDAVVTTKIKDTFVGLIDFTAPVDPAGLHNLQNNYKTPLVGVQWRKGSGKWPYDEVIVSNAAAPAMTVQDKMQPLTY